jgi:hypothetical protein
MAGGGPKVEDASLLDPVDVVVSPALSSAMFVTVSWNEVEACLQS